MNEELTQQEIAEIKILLPFLKGMPSLRMSLKEFLEKHNHDDVNSTGVVGGVRIDDTAGNGDTDKVWSADKVYDQLALKVATTGNETVAGVKTFSSFPVTPSSAPTTNYQVSNKKYVDDNGPMFSSNSFWVVDNVSENPFYYDDDGEDVTSTDYTKYKEVQYDDVDGTITVVFSAIANLSGGMEVKLYKNSTAVLTQTIGTAPAAVVTYEATVTAGDKFSVWAKLNGAPPTYDGDVSTFRLEGVKFSKPTNVTKLL
jgi:hypothetical protein